MGVFWDGNRMGATGGGTFKSDSDEHGPRLAQIRGTGVPGIMRQIRDVGVGSVAAPRERVERAREALREVERKTGRKGRPRKEGPRPWEIEGVSRTVWYRRKGREGHES